jgi:uncharacterized damage-inducible protein DinB
MPESDCLQILLAHDQWATAQLLDACVELTPEQFHRRFDIGPGSLHDTITHMLAAMRAWTETMAGTEPTPRIDADGQKRTPGELRAILDDVCKAFHAEAGRRPLSDKAMRKLRDGRTIELTRAAALMQVTTHGMHHRAQCLNMLRQLGVTPLPPSSVAEWTLLGEPRIRSGL